MLFASFGTEGNIKKAIIGMAVALLLLGSCKKAAPSSSIGTWTFQGATYYATAATGTGSVLTASDASVNNLTYIDALTFTFSGSSLPSAPGRYTIAGPYGNTAGNWVIISASVGGTVSSGWTSTGHDGAYATVSVSSQGKITVQISSVEVMNPTTSDSSAVTNVLVNQQ
jgi:hypothetical protein